MAIRDEVPYEAIGRMCVAFGTLEMAVVHLGMNVADASNARDRPRPTRLWSLSKVRKCISRLMRENPYYPDYRDRCERFLDDAQAVSRRRNEAIHTYPTLDRHGRVQMVYPGDLDRGCTTPIGVAELRGIEDDCRHLRSEASQLADLAHQSLVAADGQ